jgi:hypothetical protein
MGWVHRGPHRFGLPHPLIVVANCIFRGGRVHVFKYMIQYKRCVFCMIHHWRMNKAALFSPKLKTVLRRLWGVQNGLGGKAIDFP